MTPERHAQLAAFLGFAILVANMTLLSQWRPPSRLLLPFALLFPLGILLGSPWRHEHGLPLWRFYLGIVLSAVGMAAFFRSRWAAKEEARASGLKPPGG